MRSTITTYRSNSSSKNVSIQLKTQQKYFPQQSSKKPRQKMPTIYRHKFFDMPHLYDPAYNKFNQNPQLGLDKTQPMRKTRLDAFVEHQRDEMLMKTGRTSIDNPDWMKTTFNHYKKSNFSPPQKSDLIEERNHDIINNKRKSDFLFRSRRQQDNYYKSMISDQMSQSVELRGFKNHEMPIERKMRSTLNWMESNQRQVSPKVGALDSRDYSIKKPLLKIGKNEYVNTYSPFQNF